MEKCIALMYHQIGDIPDKYNILVENFITQLNFVNASGFQISSIENAVRYPKVCIYTFDDGFKSDLFAAEKIAEQGGSATFFLVKKFLTKNPQKYLNANDVKIISDMGHNIGVHGATHQWWTSMPEDKLLADLSGAKNYFEDLIGKPVLSCSAPGGKVNNRLINSIKATGMFSFLRNSEPKPVYDKQDFLIPGFAVDSKMDVKTIKKILAMDPLYLNYELMAYRLKKIIKDFAGK